MAGAVQSWDVGELRRWCQSVSESALEELVLRGVDISIFVV